MDSFLCRYIGIEVPKLSVQHSVDQTRGVRRMLRLLQSIGKRCFSNLLTPTLITGSCKRKRTCCHAAHSCSCTGQPGAAACRVWRCRRQRPHGHAVLSRKATRRDYCLPATCAPMCGRNKTDRKPDACRVAGGRSMRRRSMRSRSSRRNSKVCRRCTGSVSEQWKAQRAHGHDPLGLRCAGPRVRRRDSTGCREGAPCGSLRHSKTAARTNCRWCYATR